MQNIKCLIYILFGTVNNLANMFVNQRLSKISLDGLKIADGITSISTYHMFTRCGENSDNPINTLHI